METKCKRSDIASVASRNEVTNADCKSRLECHGVHVGCTLRVAPRQRPIKARQSECGICWITVVYHARISKLRYIHIYVAGIIDQRPGETSFFAGETRDISAHMHVYSSRETHMIVFCKFYFAPFTVSWKIIYRRDKRNERKSKSKKLPKTLKSEDILLFRVINHSLNYRVV